MSAYGAVTVTNRPIDPLPPTTWDLPQPSPGKPAAPFRCLVLHHLRLESARSLPAGPSLLEYTHRVFAAEIEAGRTYPQETDALAAVAVAPTAANSLSDKESNDLSGGSGCGGADTHTHTHATRAYTRAAFEAYFWAADVIIAIGQRGDDAADGRSDDGQVQVQVQVQNQNVGSGSGDLLEISRGGRSWEDALVGFYYVKPNYPGRSSHVSVFSFHDPFTLDARSHTMGWVDLQRRFHYTPCPPGIRIWKDFRQVVLALWSCARIQSKRFQSGLCK
jgi:hypothetical protein